MALNRFMHSRNPFKDKKPDFKALATKYPEFRKYATTDLKGRVHIDFKKPECLRSLSWALLKDEFGLEVDMPMDRLIPTIPLRLNYILWIEDLIGISESPQVRGIDIGTGSSCVYPLLGGRKNGWTFLATENDDLNINFAKRNIEKNSMQKLITVARSAPREVLWEPVQNSADPHQKYDFCMCNPPFFGSNLEAWGMTTSRSDDRPEPKSVSTASPGESIFPGGEVEFVRTMISDSHQLKDQVRVYTTMLGKKSSLTILKEDLRRTGVSSYGTTEFCQGRTMRWGLAWTFDPDIKFPKAPSKVQKPKKPLVYTVPRDNTLTTELGYSVTSVAQEVISCLNELKITHTQKTNFSTKKCWLIKARENTWLHQRRKRRRQERHGTEDKSGSDGKSDRKRIKISSEESKESIESETKETNPTDDHIKLSERTKKSGGSTAIVETATASNLSNEICAMECDKDKTINDSACNKNSVENEAVDTKIVEKKDNNVTLSNDVKVKNVFQPQNGIVCAENDACSSRSENLASDDSKSNIINSKSKEVGSEKQILSKNKVCNNVSNDSAEDESFILQCRLTVNKEGEDVQIQMEWVDGEGLELMHQVMQYFKNKLTK